jgi:hypothetical protein
MLFSNTLALLMAVAPATLFAAPTPTSNSLSNVLAARAIPAQALKALQDSVCDLSSVKMPIGMSSPLFIRNSFLTLFTAPTPLPVPGAGYTLRHVAIGRGVQNYTCSSAAATEKPTAIGAIATLFNGTCTAVRAPSVLADVTTMALDYAIPTSEIAQQLLSGHHEFTKDGAPLFLLDTELHKYGFVQAAKNASSNAPDTASKGTNLLGSVPWLKLTGTAGQYKEVYRLNTAGGVAPKTCEGIYGPISVPYAAEYWFYA